MKGTRRSLLLVTVLVLALLVLGASNVLADSGSATYDYLIGTGFLCGLDPSDCPAVAMADNGDTIEIAGAGTLSIHPKSVSGGGTFTHNFAGGSVSGDWTATELLSFDEYHCFSDPDLGDICGGRVLIRVHLVAAGGSLQADAILRMTCILGGKAPASAVEGIRLAIQDGLNFNQEVSGLDLFIKQ